MVTYQRYREENSTASSDNLEEVQVFDPLAELAADLALCLMSLEIGRGSFCDRCVCQLGFHTAVDDGSCELCGCIETHKKPNRNFTYMPIINSRYIRRSVFESDDAADAREPYNRYKEARMLLKELSE